MKKLLLATTIASFALSGCGTTPISTFQPYQTTDLNALMNQGYLQQKTDTFFVINDSSSSMSEIYLGEGFPGQSEPTKFSVGRELLARMNKSIPNITLSSGLRSFGYGPCLSWAFTKLNQPVQSYSSASFTNALSTLVCSSGGTTIDKAFNAASADLSSAPGNIALILLSDGHNYDGKPYASVQALKDQYGDKLCISTIWVGNEAESEGQASLEEISGISGCGYSATASELATTDGMASFVKNVFFNQVTPPAPAPLINSDGDDVPDEVDKCPDTPKNAIADKDGCWSFRGAYFDFDQYKIKPEMEHIFENSIAVLNDNPTLTIEVQGHTDSVGSDEYNKGLSERRADSVKQYLVKNGIDASRLSTQGFGESSPVASNDTEAGRAHNRRVLFKVLTK